MSEQEVLKKKKSEKVKYHIGRLLLNTLNSGQLKSLYRVNKSSSCPDNKGAIIDCLVKLGKLAITQTLLSKCLRRRHKSDDYSECIDIISDVEFKMLHEKHSDLSRQTESPSPTKPSQQDTRKIPSSPGEGASSGEDESQAKDEDSLLMGKRAAMRRKRAHMNRLLAYHHQGARARARKQNMKYINSGNSKLSRKYDYEPEDDNPPVNKIRNKGKRPSPPNDFRGEFGDDFLPRYQDEDFDVADPDQRGDEEDHGQGLDEEEEQVVPKKKPKWKSPIKPVSSEDEYDDDPFDSETSDEYDTEEAMKRGKRLSYGQDMEENEDEFTRAEDDAEEVMRVAKKICRKTKKKVVRELALDEVDEARTVLTNKIADVNGLKSQMKKTFSRATRKVKKKVGEATKIVKALQKGQDSLRREKNRLEKDKLLFEKRKIEYDTKRLQKEKEDEKLLIKRKASYPAPVSNRFDFHPFGGGFGGVGGGNDVLQRGLGALGNALGPLGPPLRSAFGGGDGSRRGGQYEEERMYGAERSRYPARGYGYERGQTRERRRNEEEERELPRRTAHNRRFRPFQFEGDGEYEILGKRKREGESEDAPEKKKEKKEKREK